MYKDDLGVVHPLEKILADIHSQIGTEEKY